MRLVGYRDGRRTIVAQPLAKGQLQPLGEVEEFWSDPYTAVHAGGSAAQAIERGSVELVPPVRGAARVLCAGLNYLAHAEEGRWQRPEHPTIFGRWTASLALDGASVEVPPGEAGLDWEGELLVVVGRPLSRCTRAEAATAIFGYSAFNDLTARTAQKLSTQWTVGKNVDNSGPMSEIVPADELGDIAGGLGITTTVNGETVQSGNTKDMLFPVDELLAFVSRTMTLQPGDLLATGTPSGVGYVREPPWFLTSGDVVDVSIERIGSVRTSIA